ncbi:MAG: hypothetical protein PHN72_05280 [Bacilli bacterium]|nr:hypothetical protein [Bacilli bacterium]
MEDFNYGAGDKPSKVPYVVMIIMAVLVTAMGISILVFASSLKPKTKMAISDFSIKTSTKRYLYSKDSIFYDGDGIITSSDKKGTYIVIMEEKLISGGDSESREKDTATRIVIVTNGVGKFTTYDSGDEGEIKKPKYGFKILGYQKLYK